MKPVSKIKELKPAPALKPLAPKVIEPVIESEFVTMQRPDGTARKTILRGSIMHTRNIERGFLEI